MPRVSGQKTVLITGCSAGGIGDALAQSFYRRGFRVFATARNLTKVQHLKDMGMDVLELDVVDAASRKAAVDHVTACTDGMLDILINNAGASYPMPLIEAELSEVRKLFELNVFSALGTTQAFATLLRKSKGTVVNISSVASRAPIPWHGPYCATKAALNQISDTLRMELEPFGVKVILVITGSVKTNFYVNNVNNSLPESSLYAPVKEKIELTTSGKAFEDSQVDLHGFAEEVVKNILKSRPTLRQWAGGNATTMWAISTILWDTVWDIFFADRFGLTELRKKLQHNKID